jgi:hypothetical protein
MLPNCIICRKEGNPGHIRRDHMKAVLLAAATVAFAAVVNVPPASAAEPSGNASPGDGQTAGTKSLGTATRTPH